MSGDKLPPALGDAIEFALGRLSDGFAMYDPEQLSDDCHEAEVMLREVWESFRAEYEQRERALAFVREMAECPIADFSRESLLTLQEQFVIIAGKEPTNG